MTSTFVSPAARDDLAELTRPPGTARDMRRRRVVRGVAAVALTAMSVACGDDGSPSNAPTDTTRTESDGSVTTVPAQTPAGGSGAVEPGTNLVPSSDPGPPGSGSLLGGGPETSTGG